MAKTYKGQYIGPDKYKGKVPTGDKGKSYKGQYIGPDKYKGKVSGYNRAAPSASRPAAPSAPSAPSAPNAPAEPNAPANPGGTQNAPVDPAGVTSNASGNVQLQSTFELNKAELDAQQEYQDQLNNYKMKHQEAINNAARRRQELAQAKDTGLGKINSSLAYRGMGYSSAAEDKVGKFSGEVQRQSTDIADEETAANNLYGENGQARALAKDKLNQRLGLVTQGRKDFTDKQSATSPTEGSSPEDAGVSPITLPKVNKPRSGSSGSSRNRSNKNSNKDKDNNKGKQSAAARRAAAKKAKAAKEAADKKAAAREAAKRRASNKARGK